MAALKVRWKLAEGHCPANCECTTAETVCPAKTKSTFGSVGKAGSLRQECSNSVLSTGLLSCAMNLCVKATSSGASKRLNAILRYSLSTITDF